MARIRTVKPEFFRHEQLQDLEIEYPGQYCMLVFVGLWTQADNNGIFQDRPRQLKLDILPFIEFDFEKTLSILENRGFLYRYESDGSRLAIIPTLPRHQRFSGKEAGEAGSRYPLPSNYDREAIGKQQGSVEFIPVAQEKERSIGKGKDMENFPCEKKSKPKSPKFNETQFEKFWNRYPKKVGKGAARTSFLKIKVDTDPDSMLDTILRAIGAQSDSSQWKKENGKYIPNPATWLNQERWQDEIEPPEYELVGEPPPGWTEKIPDPPTRFHGMEGI